MEQAVPMVAMAAPRTTTGSRNGPNSTSRVKDLVARRLRRLFRSPTSPGPLILQPSGRNPSTRAIRPWLLLVRIAPQPSPLSGGEMRVVTRYATPVVRLVFYFPFPLTLFFPILPYRDMLARGQCELTRGRPLLQAPWRAPSRYYEEANHQA